MKDEFIYNVDENDNVIGKISRKEGGEKKLRRRVSRVFIFNSKNEMLLQKRASEKIDYPTLWDFGCAETVLYGEKYESAAIRGLFEELGIKGISSPDIKFLFKLKFTSAKAKRWYAVYSLIYNGKVRFDKNEISEIKFASEGVLNKMLKTENFSPAGLEVYKQYEKIKK